MLKYLILAASSVLAQQMIDTDSNELQDAIHERMLQRRDFYIEGTCDMLHNELIKQEDEVLKQYLRSHHLSEDDFNFAQYNSAIAYDRHDQEEFYRQTYTPLAN